MMKRQSTHDTINDDDDGRDDDDDAHIKEKTFAFFSFSCVCVHSPLPEHHSNSCHLILHKVK